MEAWGRKKRSVGADIPAGSVGKQLGDDMTLSREIVVLDLKDKAEVANESGNGSDNNSDIKGAQKSSLRSGQLSSSSGLGDQNGLDSSTLLSSSSNQFDGLQTSNMHCVTSQSLLVLTCSIGLFLVLYVCVVAYFFAHRRPKISPIKHQYH